MLATRFTELVGCDAPIQLAGMGGVCGPDLVAAVADAGGLAMLAQPTAPPDVLAPLLDSLRERTRGAVGVNFLIPWLERECVAVAASRIRVVEFFYGDPDASLVEEVHRGGALASWQVGSLAEAKAAAGAGCDLVAVQGIEAGGHVRGELGLLPLLAEVLDAVRVPVIAAGGIATARGVAAVLAAGASAARVGTRFIATPEADAHPDWVARLLGARGEDTVVTQAYSLMWPDAPHRVLRSAPEAAEALEDDLAGEILLDGRHLPVPRWAPATATRSASGAIEAMALYAGQSAGSVHEVAPAADVVRELCDGAERLLRDAAGLLGGASR